MADDKVTRSIKVELSVNDIDKNKSIRLTHSIFSFMVKYYMDLLLDMRSGDVHLRLPDGSEETKTQSFYAARLMKRMEDKNKSLSLDQIEEFRAWSSSFFIKVMNADKPKGLLNEIQTIKAEKGKGGTPSAFDRSIHTFFSEHGDLDIPDEFKKYIPDILVKSSGWTIHNLEIGAWIDDNKEKLSQVYGEDVINKILENYAKKVASKEKSEADNASNFEKFGPSGSNLLPIAESPIKVFAGEKFKYDKELKGESTWKSAAWCCAVARLQSWYKLNDKPQKSREKAEKEVSEYIEKQKTILSCDFVKKLQKYEDDRAKEIKERNGEESGKYRIMNRQIRGIDELVRKWQKAKDFTERKAILDKIQSDDADSVGDVNLLCFLAGKEDEGIYELLLQDENFKSLKTLCSLNKEKEIKDNHKGYACLSMADMISSPAWVEYEYKAPKHPGNKPAYNISVDSKTVSIPLFEIEGDGNIRISEGCCFHYKNNVQMNVFHFDDSNKLIFKDHGTGWCFPCSIGGAKIQFSRHELERTQLSESLNVYLNMSFELSKDQTNKEQTKIFENSMVLYSKNDKTDKTDKTAMGFVFDKNESSEIFKSGSTRNIESINELINKNRPLRVMAVDLGIRTLFSYSVFSVCNSKPVGCKRNSLEIHSFFDGTPLQTIHERSGQILLYGDRPSAKEEKARIDYEQKCRSMKRKIRAIMYFRRLANTPVKDRDKKIRQLMDRYSHDDWPYIEMNYDMIIRLVSGYLGDTQDKWAKQIDSIAFVMKRNLSKEYKAWVDYVKKPRVLNGTGFAGTSIWSINSLTEVRKIKLMWHTLAEKSGQLSGLIKNEVFDRELMDHITAIKKNRIKDSSDSLLMTALGFQWVSGNPTTRMVKILGEDGVISYVSENDYIESKGTLKPYATGKSDLNAKKGFWVKRYERCDVIVFEELQKYKTSDERTRKENRQLMTWAHRSCLEQLKMQSSVFPIMIGSVGASYSSRFHATTHAPGVRANVYSKEQLESLIKDIEKTKKRLTFFSDMSKEEILKFIFKTLDYMNKDKKRTVGVLIPENGGEYFITLKKSSDGDKKPIYLNADINAAQNLAIRWISRYEYPERLKVKVPENMNGINTLQLKKKGKSVEMVIKEDSLVLNEESSMENNDFSGILGKSLENRKVAGTSSETDVDEDDDLSVKYIFCDRSGVFFNNTNQWFSSYKFWREVRTQINGYLLENPILIKA